MDILNIPVCFIDRSIDTDRSVNCSIDRSTISLGLDSKSPNIDRSIFKPVYDFFDS